MYNLKMIKILSKVKHCINFFLGLIGYRVLKIGPYGAFDFESFLYQYIAVKKSFTFIQIGANDGVMNDPVYRFNIKNKAFVKGFVLEPLPDIYEKLVKNYKSCKYITPCNIAIHSSKSEMVLNRVKPTFQNKVPKFARGIASFDEMHWKKTELIPNSNYMEQVKVNCVKFSDFINSKNISNLDLLLMDTEGYDYEIIMSVDFKNFKPRIIRFEHGVRNKLMSINQFKTVCEHLNAFGYQIITESYDATAYLLDPNDLLIEF